MACTVCHYHAVYVVSIEYCYALRLSPQHQDHRHQDHHSTKITAPRSQHQDHSTKITAAPRSQHQDHHSTKITTPRSPQHQDHSTKITTPRSPQHQDHCTKIIAPRSPLKLLCSCIRTVLAFSFVFLKAMTSYKKLSILVSSPFL